MWFEWGERGDPDQAIFSRDGYWYQESCRSFTDTINNLLPRVFEEGLIR
jgi:hypothetical protein